MKEQCNMGLPESLAQLPTPQLDAMLRSELEKELPDGNTVRLIMKILRAREADYPVLTNEKIDAAWERYRQKTTPKRSPLRTPLFRAAAVLILCGLLLAALPQEASADNFFERIAVWTESVFELLSFRSSREPAAAYQFKTDHPGLQQLYDTVTEQGVTVPVVPMWLDGEYGLQDCRMSTTPVTTKIQAFFSDGEKYAVFELNIYSDNIPREFYKDEPEAETYEQDDIIHHILQNDKLWTVIWTRENIECFVTIDCPEEDLYRMIDSIYTMED